MNPIKYAYNVGFSGNGVVPGRPDDAFGVGWSRLQFSNNLFPFLRDTLRLGLDHEDAIELYYNLAATKWLGPRMWTRRSSVACAPSRASSRVSF